ncbi:hypothetical protein K438DRAFT_458161 [Mycena galopus ATCC 62051]|nr:hypothetical protein K438DRAFT_458161 [Mycena galopus ATCC 62051]
MSPGSQPVPRTCPHCLALFETEVEVPKIRDSDGSDILKTNRPPTDPEIPHILSAIDEERAQKMRLEARIAAVESLLKALMADYDKIEEKIRTYEGSFSLLRRIPTELLSLIFVFASTSTPWVPQDPAPWTASQVCRRWRAITLFQSTFWASIDLDFGRMASVDRKTRTPFRLEAQVKRAGNLPLQVDFACHFKREITEQESAVFTVLARHSARWQKVRISGPISLSSDLACIRGNLPHLSKLQVFFLLPTQDSFVVDAFELAPNLREATINMEYSQRGTVSVALPSSRLQRYAARGTWTGHIRTLQSASNLVDCGLDASTDDLFIPPTTLIVLPHLLRLSLSDSIILGCLEAPQLEELYCSGQPNHLSSLFDHRRPQRLHKLVLPFLASVADICGILRSVPTITDIGVSVSTDSLDDLFTALLLQNEPTDIGLALRSIILDCNEDYAGTQPYNPEALDNMVTSRWRTGRLRSIHIPDTTFPTMRSWRLKELKREGLIFTCALDKKVWLAWRWCHLICGFLTHLQFVRIVCALSWRRTTLRNPVLKLDGGSAFPISFLPFLFMTKMKISALTDATSNDEVITVRTRIDRFPRSTCEDRIRNSRMDTFFSAVSC